MKIGCFRALTVCLFYHNTISSCNGVVQREAPFDLWASLKMPGSRHWGKAGEKLYSSVSLCCMTKGTLQYCYSNKNIFDRHHVSLNHVWLVCGALVGVISTTVTLSIPGSGWSSIYIIGNTDVIPWSRIQSHLRSGCRHSGCAGDKVVVDHKIVVTALLMPLVVHRIHKALCKYSKCWRRALSKTLRTRKWRPFSYELP